VAKIRRAALFKKIKLILFKATKITILKSTTNNLQILKMAPFEKKRKSQAEHK